ncbi:MAG TPA: LacI family DNA-binding transcriptional regulator [Phototrophicaceae bacterium]|nr:LacI family DNA-binding transcriptional regulator [Phototrophicaceae bacterium]
MTPSRTHVAGNGRAATLSDVAREAGVSLATASRAINGSTNRSVRADLRERVLEAAARLDYSPNANAQAMARGRTATLGLIVHDIADPFFSTIAAGVTEAADDAGLAVTLANTHHDAERELGFIQTLHNLRARSIILVGGRQDDDDANERLRDALAGYRERGGTVAMVGQPILDVSAVHVDNRGASAELARALHGLGYRRFAILGGPERHLTGRERREGFREALAELGSPVPDDAVVPSEFVRDGGYSAMTEVLRRELDVEMVFAVNDVMALGAMTAAREAGVDVPRDIGFAGFDDIYALRDVTPTLTTVRIDMVDIGRQVTALALTEPEEPGLVTVSGEVVLRESTPGSR